MRKIRFVALLLALALLLVRLRELLAAPLLRAVEKEVRELAVVRHWCGCRARLRLAVVRAVALGRRRLLPEKRAHLRCKLVLLLHLSLSHLFIHFCFVCSFCCFIFVIIALCREEFVGAVLEVLEEVKDVALAHRGAQQDAA